MRFLKFIGSATALIRAVSAQAVSTSYCDSVTKICYQSYTNTDTNITIRIALPTNVTSPYDAIVQIVSPLSNPWVGLAWGGTMVFNPLTVAWPNGASVVPSARFAYGLSLPGAYDGAEHFLMKGSGANATHWTLTALCKGCTSYMGNEGTLVTLNGTGTAELAWAQGGAAVAEPSNNNTSFNVHSSFGKWTHDLNAARSSQFQSWVAANMAPQPTQSTTSRPATSTSTTTSTSVSTVSVPVPSGTGLVPSTCGASAPKFNPVFASGWKGTKVLGGLTSPRSIVFDTAGNMLVVQSGKGISVHAVSSNGCPSSSKMLISQNNLNHGIQLSADGKTLYASSATQVYQWTYDAATTSVTGSSKVIIKGMFNGVHTTRTLLIAPHKPNLLLVSHGSNDNWDYPTGNPKTGRSVVRVFDLNAIPSAGYNWPTDGWLAGYGMRNEVGICFDANNMLWGVENSGDQFTRSVGNSKVDIHNDNPAEELNYIGDITKENTKWFGYPTCFTVWQPSSFTDAKFQVGDQFVVAPNSTFKDSNCVGLSTPPSTSFQAHSAPIDCKFDATSSNVYVTFHGSWNRSPTTGFKLVVVPMKKGTDGAYVPVAPASSATGYNDIMTNANVAQCVGNGPVQSTGCFRPAGLMYDKQGRLYMTSDTTSEGEIWIVGKS